MNVDESVVSHVPKRGDMGHPGLGVSDSLAGRAKSHISKVRFFGFAQDRLWRILLSILVKVRCGPPAEG